MNICRAQVNRERRTITTRAVLCTKDVELYVLMLTCPI
jgi:hypothetical protein